MPDRGVLYVVATPVGNLGDLTARAAEVLRSVDLVAAEDTRRSRTVLLHVGATPRVLSFHAHSPPRRAEEIVEVLRSGRSVALLTDAGTPTVSDPGVALVRRVRDEDVRVVPVPGASAVPTALSASGLPADRFTFLGFLPRRGGERRTLLETVAASPWTVVLFEAPARLVTLLQDLAGHCGDDRQAVVARELTKVHEEVVPGTLAELAVYYRDRPPRGEITLVIAGRRPEVAEVDRESAEELGRSLLDRGMSRRDAAAELSSVLDIPRNEAYRLITSL